MAIDQSVEVRVRRLEQKVRRAVSGVVVLGCLLVVAMVSGVVSLTRGRVVARELVITDSTGQARMSFLTNPDGRPLLLLQDASGQPGIVMGYTTLGKPSVSVGRFGPGTRIGFSADHPVVQLRDDSGTTLLELGVGADGRPGVRVAGDEELQSVTPG